jgi:hypothetical protein
MGNWNMDAEVVAELMQILDGRLQLADVQSADDATLDALAELLLNWHEVASSEQDERRMRKR